MPLDRAASRETPRGAPVDAPADLPADLSAHRHADPPGPDEAPARTDVYRPAHRLDVRRTLAPLRRGSGDPCWWTSPDGAVWQATATPDGPATRRLAVHRDGVHVAAWGPGAERAVAAVPDLLGARDDPSGFDASLHPVVRDAHRRLPGLRVPFAGDVLASLVPAVLEQRVVGIDARAAWRRLVTRHGERAPGPVPASLRVPPPWSVWAALPVWEWRQAGVDDQRSSTVQRAAAVGRRLDETVTMPLPDARRRFLAVRGIGPWTVAETTARALGDADAVSVGDFHLAHLVGWALTGHRTDDDGMLALLEPWRGHRQRVVRLLEITQASQAPRFGPRSPRALPLR